jgi:small subunit ribosomal protein S1
VLDIDKENRRLSLGHKQLEDNPWDAFEAKYAVGTVHEGTITEDLEKGSVVQLEENVEGFATPKHLVKEDGSQAKQGEVLPFKVIEFNKDSKRIILSHSRTFEDAQREEKRAARKATQAPRAAAKKDDSPKIENVAASTSLGDIDVLAQLKAQMEKSE